MTERKPPRPPAAVLFDLDGTLVDTEPLHQESVVKVLGRHGAWMTDEAFRSYIGWAEEPFWEAVAREHGLPESPRRLAELRTEALLELFRGTAVPVLPGARELLEELAAWGIPAAVASSSPRAQIEATLREAGLRDLVAELRSGHDDVERGKPAPDVYLSAAEAVGADPRWCLAVEDSATGLRSARAAGCFAVAVPCPSHPETDLDAAHLVLPSLGELRGVLEPEGGR